MDRTIAGDLDNIPVATSSNRSKNMIWWVKDIDNVEIKKEFQDKDLISLENHLKIHNWKVKYQDLILILHDY